MILQGDCLEHLRTMESNSLDSLVTDPPAGIAFMGKDWDKDKGGRDAWVAWMTDVMRECLRVLKPGAHGLVWALPRTSHWTATALENAGFQIRDVVTHLFGSGFPKSLNVGNGWGTALKPASEHWILIRKPLGEKTVAANVLKHGTGAINVDGCRIGTEARVVQPTGTRIDQCEGRDPEKFAAWQAKQLPKAVTGRFPANLVLTCCGNEPHDETCAVRMLDEQSGVTTSQPRRLSATEKPDIENAILGKTGRRKESEHADSGGASRFFYVAKASKSDRQRKARG